MFFTHFPEAPNCEVCKLTTTTWAPCKNRPEARGDRNHHPQILGDATTADHKVPSKENESRLQHRHAVMVHELYSRLIQSFLTKNKIAQDTMKRLQKFVQLDQIPSIIRTDNSLDFVRDCEDQCWNHGKSTPYRSETNGIA